MNEWFFFLHLALVSLFLWPAYRFGREGLICWIALQPIMANLFVLKQIDFFGYTVTCSDVYAVACALGLNVLQEYFGKEAAQKAVRLCFYLMVFFLVMSQCQLLYQPSTHDTAHVAYDAILSVAPRLVIASILSFVTVQLIDVHFFAFLKRRAASLPLLYRNLISLTLSQLIDTLLFSFLGLWGYVSHLFDVILVSFLIKLVISVLLSLSSIKSKNYEPVSL